jgi:hypothetical protein
VIPKGVDSDTTNFRILSSCIVFRDKRLDLSTHRVLTRDCSETSGFCATLRFQQISTMLRFDSSQLGSTFALSKFSVQSLLERLQS